MRFSQTHLDKTINHRDILLSHCLTVLLTRCHSVLLPHYPTGPSLLPPHSAAGLLFHHSIIPLSRYLAIPLSDGYAILLPCCPIIWLSDYLTDSPFNCHIDLQHTFVKYLLEGALGVGLVCTPVGGSGYLGPNIGLWGGDGVSGVGLSMTGARSPSF